MKYVNSLELGKKAIIDSYPEFEGKFFDADDSGWTNFAIKVDGKFLFRFPRDDDAYNAITKEYNILSVLDKKLPSYIKVPRYKFFKLDCDYPFVGYELIGGNFLSRKIYNTLTDSEKEHFLSCIGEFLNILHSIDYHNLGLEITDSKEWYQDLYGRIKKICYNYFDDELKKLTDNLFNNYFNDINMHNYQPTLVHGDLSGDHILITDDGIGIIDFGDLMVFDPAYDFIWAYILDINFYKKLISIYNGNYDDYFEHRICDFHMIRPPYDGIIYADSIKDSQLISKNIDRLKRNFKI